MHLEGANNMRGLGSLVHYLVCLALLASLGVAQESDLSSDPERTPLVVLLLDGFRWDYLKYLDSSAQGFPEFFNGTSARYVTSIFPSTSYPAWTTISTGLYPEDHGIIANFFYNRQRKSEFALTDSSTTLNPHWWQNVEPVWTTATRAGRHTTTILWSRSDVFVRGFVPQDAQGYQQRPDTLVELQSTLIRTVDYLGKGSDFILAYNEHLDVIGHEYGPDSNDMKIAINEVDRYLAQFFEAMKKRDMYGKGTEATTFYRTYISKQKPRFLSCQYFGDRGGVDLIKPFMAKKFGNIGPHNAQNKIFSPFKIGKNVTEKSFYEVNVLLISDHGMAKASHPKAVIDLQKVLSIETDIEKAYPQGPFVAVYARPGRIENVVSNLRKIKGITAYRRGEVPEELHYNKHPNLPDIVICAHKGYTIKTALFTKETGPAGQHGYSPKEEDMRTIFMATGPDFKTNTIGGPIELVDEYQIFCHLLQIRPKPHNGTWEHVRHLLKGDPTHPFGEEAPPAISSTTTTSTTLPPLTSQAPSVPAPVRRPAKETPVIQNEISNVDAEKQPPANRRQSSSAVSQTPQSLLPCFITLFGWYFARQF